MYYHCILPIHLVDPCHQLSRTFENCFISFPFLLRLLAISFLLVQFTLSALRTLMYFQACTTYSFRYKCLCHCGTSRCIPAFHLLLSCFLCLKRGVICLHQEPPVLARDTLVDTPAAWVHYTSTHCAQHDSLHDTVMQQIRLDVPQMKLSKSCRCEHIAHVMNYIFVQGYLPCKVRLLLSWKGACTELRHGARFSFRETHSDSEGVYKDKLLRH